MTNEKERTDSFSTPCVSANTASITGIVDYVSWYRDEPLLKFAQPGVAIHQRPDIALTKFIDTNVKVVISENKYCTECGKKTESSPCPDCAGEPPYTSCVMCPTIHCDYMNCPYPDYKQRSCSHTHVVYFVTTDRVKVGITRESRARRRWAEQGASHAIPIARAPNRKAAGIIETALSTKWSHRRHHRWYQPMDDSVQRLVDDTLSAIDLIPKQLRPCFLWEDASEEVVRDAVVELPSVESSSLEGGLVPSDCMMNAGETREGRVLGIRGRLIATDGFVINLNTYSGHVITLETNDPFFEDADLRVKVDSERSSQDIDPDREDVLISEEVTA